MIVLVGLAPTSSLGSRAFQEFDPTALFGSIAKRVFVANRVEALPAVLDQALRVAITGRPGPVVVGIPIDVLGAAPPDLRLTVAGTDTLAEPVTWDASRIGSLLNAAEHPILLIGTEAVRSTVAARVQTLATVSGLPVFTAWRRYSAIDNSHPNFAGSLGRGAPRAVRSSTRSADVVLSIGFAIDDITAEVGAFNRAGVTIVQLAAAPDPDLPRHLDNARVIQVSIDPIAGVDGLLAWFESNGEMADALRMKHGEFTQRAVAANRTREELVPRPGRVHSQDLMYQLNRVLPDDAVVTSDVGNFTQSLLRYVSYDRDRVFVGPLSGAMGYGIPSAIGAALAAPHRPVWCVGGDGGIGMTACEMATAASNAIEMVVVVIDNGIYGTIRNRQHIEFPDRPMLGTQIGGVDFAALARSMGWSAWTVEVDDDVDRALAEAVHASGCRLIHAIVEERPWALS
jgi:acetolactate synthase-1/2/3 large subunit